MPTPNEPSGQPDAEAGRTGAPPGDCEGLSGETLEQLNRLYYKGYRYSCWPGRDGQRRCVLLEGGLGPGVEGEGATDDEAARRALDKVHLRESRQRDRRRTRRR